MGTVHSSTVVTVSGGFQSVQTLSQEQWLTHGITASSSSSGTCTTSTTTVSWIKTTSNAWPFATPSSKAKVTGTKPHSRRTRRSWLTCGTRLPSWLTSTRTTKLAETNSQKPSKVTVLERHMLIFHLPLSPL